MCSSDLVVPMLRSHFRFVGGLGVLWLPFAGAAMAMCLQRMAAQRPIYRTGLMLLFCLANVGIFDARSQDRIVERELGRALRARLQPGETIASDMPTMLYYAGLQPPPPRAIERDELLQRADTPQCRFVAFVEGRTDVPLATWKLRGFALIALPTELANLTAARRIVVLGR